MCESKTTSSLDAPALPERQDLPLEDILTHLSAARSHVRTARDAGLKAIEKMLESGYSDMGHGLSALVMEMDQLLSDLQAAHEQRINEHEASRKAQIEEG
jgi:hypothetical protein